MPGEDMLPAGKAKIEADLKDLQGRFDALAKNTLLNPSRPPADLTMKGSASNTGAALQNPGAHAGRTPALTALTLFSMASY
jgi:hypothetical protein